jgi:hypothetical protein
MKLFWRQVQIGSHLLVVPRVELEDGEPSEMLQAHVSLSRVEGGCVYPLYALEAHDDHAPPWHLDGTAPAKCSDPSATAAKYMQRIEEAIRNATGATLSVTVLPVETVEEPSEPSAGPLDEPSADVGGDEPSEPDDDWKRYGVH